MTPTPEDIAREAAETAEMIVAYGQSGRHNVGLATKLIMKAIRSAVQAEIAEPIPMVLWCPACGMQHIDEPAPEKGWDNPPHRSHECQACGLVWRPADVPTTGVGAIRTKGARDGRAIPHPEMLRSRGDK